MAIIRGRFATRSFTQVPNDWLRDPRLSYKAKGILAYIASHRADYELTVEQIAAEGREGRDAIQSGLRELVTVGYLVRQQRRNPDGTLGGIDYRIVETPGHGSSVSGSAGDGKSGRGAEQGKQPDCAGQAADGKSGHGRDQQKQDVSAGQTVDGFSGYGKSAPKNTVSQNTKNTEEDSLSTPEPDDRSAVVDDRERDGDPPKDEPQDLRHRYVIRHGATPDEAPRVVAAIHAEYAPRNNGWWRTVDRQGDLGDIVAQALTRVRATPNVPTPAGQPDQRPHCGGCDPNRLIWVRSPSGRVGMAPCPNCHRRGKPLPAGAVIVDGPEHQDPTPQPARPGPECGRPGCRDGWYRLGVNRVRCHVCPDPNETPTADHDVKETMTS